MLKKTVNKVGLPFIIISAFFILLLIAAAATGQNMGMLFSDILNRWGMNGILVLAMVPSIQSGVGLNFGISIGIVSGLLGTLIAMEFNLMANPAFANSPQMAMLTIILLAIIFAIIIGLVMGWLYGMFLNLVKGYETTVSTYVGFAVVALMNIFWLKLPFKNPEAIWAVGGSGLRNTVSLEKSFGKFLNNLWMITIGDPKTGILKIGNMQTGAIYIPTGLLLIFAIACFVVWVFLHSKSGIAMSAAGANERYAKASGINPNKTRLLGTMLSTVLGAVGIIVSAQSYGFIQLYNAPKMLSFSIVASILIGGATTMRARIFNVVIGTLMFHGLLVVSMPVVNSLLPGQDVSEIIRIIISQGIILYALTQGTAGGASHE